MQTNELREKYLAFFETKGHTRRPSDVLVPTWDPSVLFTPAGMNQFKDHFLGRVKLDFTRATTCQKCLRTGDIDNVGRTAYHHTFFEMLGNFSFGDYFKREAIRWAWEFLTKKEWLGLDPDRLSATVYKDDEESATIWAEDVGLPQRRIGREEEDENFWPASAPSQGPDGVCGPCSEIYYHPPQGKPVEIWNLVFTQFNRVGPPPDNLRPLPSKNIDTGMGLERTAATLQGVNTNYHIDILRPIVEAAGEVCGMKYDPESDEGRRLRRITDHVRACVFAVHENVYPGPNKEKYVIRRLLRRAVLDGRQLGRTEPFLHKLVPAVVEQMKAAYPELTETDQRVASVIKGEESNFFATIDGGLARIEDTFKEMESSGRVMVDGVAAADLYQTYGVPPELFESLAADRNFTFDWRGFRKAMEEHGVKSGGDQKELFKTGPIEAIKKATPESEFVGYDRTQAEATVIGIVRGHSLLETFDAAGHDDAVRIVLDRSPFYGESGGQVGDTGEIISADSQTPGRFVVTDTQKDGGLIVHFGQLVEGTLKAGATVFARVDAARRAGIQRAHSATHILHHALRNNLGQHAQQQGSKVDEDWLRFDFTNMEPVTAEVLDKIEQDVQDKVTNTQQVSWQTLPLAQARAAGAIMLFGEKYPDPVRMVSMGEFSRELCGGTHLTSTGDVQAFDLIGEEGVSAGTRRVVALTGKRARKHIEDTLAALRDAAQTLGCGWRDVPTAAQALSNHVRDLKKAVSGGGKTPKEPTHGGFDPNSDPPPYHAIKATLREAARVLNVAPFDVPGRVESLLSDIQSLQRQLEELAATGDLSADSLLQSAATIGETKMVVAEVPGGNANRMRQLIDQIRQKTSSSAVLLGGATGEGKVMLVAGVSHDLIAKGAKAGDWVKAVAPVVGGGGGGKPDMAQAGGKDPSKLAEALETAKAVMSRKLGG